MDEYLMAFFFGIFTYFLGKILSKINLNKQSLILIENKTFSKSSELLIREQLKRNYEFFEEKGMKLIRDSTILIYGLEGIGSHVCLTLIRSGVKKLIIIDNNTLTKEFFPYHPLSILSDLGKRNIDIIDFYGKRINPNVIIEKYYDNVNEKLLNKIIKENKINVVVDTLLKRKNLNEKCKLIKYCSDHNLNLIISLFPQLEKFNPIYIRENKFSLVQNDIFAKEINNIYKKNYNSIVPDFKTIFSIEKDEDIDLEKLPELNPIYANFSNTICSIILCEISNFSFGKNLNENKKKNDDEIMIGSKKLSKLIEDYKKDEVEKKNIKIEELNMSYDDYKKIANLFKNMSSVSQKQGPKMQFIRWKLYEKPSINNLVILNKNEISKHINTHNEIELINLYGNDTVERINKKLNEIK